jgi:hypothetical protein
MMRSVAHWMSSIPPAVHLDLVALWVDTGLSNRGRPPAAEAVRVIDMAVPPASVLLAQLIPLDGHHQARLS